MNSSVDDFECADDLNEAVGPILQEVIPENGDGNVKFLDDVCNGLFSLIRA